MADVFSKKKRSEVMSGIRSKDTKPEYFIRSALHRNGYRFRLHASELPGKPDLVFPKYNAIIFVHGCFWHGHDCHLFKWPKTRVSFWKSKILKNQENDHKVLKKLKALGWRILIIWECAIKGKEKLDPSHIIRKSSTWLKSRIKLRVIKGGICGRY